MAGRQAGFFDVGERLYRLSNFGDQFKGHTEAVDFKLFRSELQNSGPRASFNPCPIR